MPDLSGSVQHLNKAPYLAHWGDPARMDLLWQEVADTPATLTWGTDEELSDAVEVPVSCDADHL